MNRTHTNVNVVLTLALVRAPEVADLYRVSASSDGILLTLTLQGTVPSGVWRFVRACDNVISEQSTLEGGGESRNLNSEPGMTDSAALRLFRLKLSLSRSRNFPFIKSPLPSSQQPTTVWHIVGSVVTLFNNGVSRAADWIYCTHHVTCVFTMPYSSACPCHEGVWAS